MRRRQPRGAQTRPPPSTEERQPWLPRAPNATEKYSYVKRRPFWVTAVSLVSFSCLVYSQVKFLSLNSWLATLYPALVFTILYYIIAFVVNIGAKSFNVAAHEALLYEVWEKNKKLGGTAPTIVVLLPVRGEPLPVLRNTWEGVKSAMQYYRSVGGANTRIMAFVADDGGSAEVAQMAESAYFRGAGFVYLSRPKELTDKTVDFDRPELRRPPVVDETVNLFSFAPVHKRGEKKKAGNLMAALEAVKKHLGSDPEYCAVFDADFVPGWDYFVVMAAYMIADPYLGIIQSPQYFQVLPGVQNWLERGAGTVQELFYRSIQQSRDQLDGAICVGTNALYRYAALVENGGGPTLADHSEDVRTGSLTATVAKRSGG